jgi:hypothetical protein
VDLSTLPFGYQTEAQRPLVASPNTSVGEAVQTCLAHDQVKWNPVFLQKRQTNPKGEQAAESRMFSPEPIPL